MEPFKAFIAFTVFGLAVYFEDMNQRQARIYRIATDLDKKTDADEVDN